MHQLTLADLDESKTYYIGVIGKGWTSRIIKSVSHSDYFKEKDHWSHIAMLFYEKGWQVVELHMLTGGGTQQTFYSWILTNGHKRNQLIQFDYDVELAKENVGMSYGSIDIPLHFIWSLIRRKNFTWDNIVQPNTPGRVCSEGAGHADKEKKVHEYVGKRDRLSRDAKDHELKPQDFKDYAYAHNIKIYDLNARFLGFKQVT